MKWLNKQAIIEYRVIPICFVVAGITNTFTGRAQRWYSPSIDVLRRKLFAALQDWGPWHALTWYPLPLLFGICNRQARAVDRGQGEIYQVDFSLESIPDEQYQIYRKGLLAKLAQSARPRDSARETSFSVWSKLSPARLAADCRSASWGYDSRDDATASCKSGSTVGF